MFGPLFAYLEFKQIVRLDSSHNMPGKQSEPHQLLLDNLNTAVVLVDASLAVVYMNPAAENLFATSAHRLAGNTIVQLFGDTKARITFHTALLDGHPFTERKVKLNLPDQREITIDYSVTPITAGSDKLLLLEIQSVDRILRIDREEALISANNSSRDLIRGLAHEIKNPLGGILGASQLLAEELDRSDLREYTDIIVGETERLRHLVDRLLGPSSLPRLAAVNIHQVTERVASLLRAETGGRLAIVRDYDPSIPPIQGDWENLVQAVLNLVRNAMQALDSVDRLDADGVITLRTRIVNHFTIGKIYHRVVCQLDVIDNGPGVPEEISERIFYPMVSGRAGGTGLGLSIAQSAIHLHQGLIECKSEPGHTRFSVFLPLEPHKRYGH